MPTGSSAKILLVDDRSDNLYALEAILGPLGHGLVKANSGVEALKHVLAQDFAVILMDVQMPDMDGFEAVSLIKKREKSRLIPIIFVTAISTDESHIFQGYTSGAVDYIAKPFNPDILRSKVKIFIDLFDKTEQIKKQAKQLQASERREAERKRLELEHKLQQKHLVELAGCYAREKRIAEVLQRSMLLAPQEDEFPGITLATFYEAAWDEASLGGDFFDFFSLGPNKVALSVGDVTGKGLDAAARTAEIKYSMRAFLRECVDPALTLQRLNKILCISSEKDFGVGSFTCLALIVLDTITGDAQISSGGMEPPILCGTDGSVRPIDVKGLPLGIHEEEAYPMHCLTMLPGESLVVVTDGVTEARQGDHLLGYENLCDILARLLPSGSPRKISESILEEARAFAGGKLQDDACLLMVQRTPTI